MDLYFSVIKYRIYPIIPALFLILFPSYYSKNYSRIMCACLISTQNLVKQVATTEKTLCTIKLKEGESVNAHIKAMSEIFEVLAAIGDAVSEEDRIFHLLAITRFIQHVDNST